MSVSTDTATSAASYLASLPAIDPDMTAAMRSRAGVTDADPPADPPSHEPSASVAGNSLVAFTDKLDGTHKTELLYAVGFAQLQAVQAGHDPKTDPIGYYKFVTDMLTNIGFVAQTVSFASYETSTKTVELDTVVLKILADILTGPELALVDAAVAALKATADDDGGPWTIYSNHSVSNKAGGFGLGIANQTEGKDGKTANVSLKLGAFTFDGSTTETTFLWMSYSSTDIKIQDGNTTVVLNDDLWNHPGVGDAIATAMGDHSAGYIAHLPPLKAN